MQSALAEKRTMLNLPSTTDLGDNSIDPDATKMKALSKELASPLQYCWSVPQPRFPTALIQPQACEEHSTRLVSSAWYILSAPQAPSFAEIMKIL